jgi:alpha-methylacyl-CoA racemase
MLDSCTLVDFTSMGPGPRCTRLLADYGMRVIKIRPPVGGSRMMDAPWYSYSANRGIPQVHVDLKQERGRQLVHRILARADVLVESYRPGVAARLGLGYDDVRADNEGIVYCSVSGFGQTGPYAQWPAHDLNWLALGGFLHAGSRRANGAPSLPGAVVADASGGYSAATAILAALVRKAATGQGCYLDVSVIDSVLRVMQYVMDGQLAGDEEVGTPAAMLTGGRACYDIYQAADGRWVSVAAIEPHFWAALCTELGLPHRIPDQHDLTRQDVLREELSRAFATRSSDDWLQALGPVACVAPVNSPAEVLCDPHLRHRPFTLNVTVEGEPVRQMTPRLPVEDPAGPSKQPAGPTPAAEVDALLQQLGIDPDDIAGLRQAGVITESPKWRA